MILGANLLAFLNDVAPLVRQILSESPLIYRHGTSQTLSGVGPTGPLVCKQLRRGNDASAVRAWGFRQHNHAWLQISGFIGEK